jgi:hypothetical protein
MTEDRDKKLIKFGRKSEIIDKKAQSKAYAKELYFKYYTQELIASMANVTYGALKKWIYTGLKDEDPWKLEREELEKQKIEAIAEEKMPLIIEITGLTMVALRDGLQQYIKRGGTPTLQELAQLSGILEKSYKFGALATGSPTEITEVKPTKQIKNMEDVRDVIIEHPFFGDGTTQPKEI